MVNYQTERDAIGGGDDGRPLIGAGSKIGKNRLRGAWNFDANRVLIQYHRAGVLFLDR